MCGNGLRVFVYYLRIQGVIDLRPGQSMTVVIRGGVKTVSSGGVVCTIGMGEYGLPCGDAGNDMRMTALGVGERPVLGMIVPNLHTVVLLDSVEELAAA